MRVEHLILGQLDTNCWLASDGAGGPLVVIDPAGDEDLLLRAIGERKVASVVLTHGHFDHLGAAAALLAKTGATFAVHRQDAPAVTSIVENGAAVFGFDDVAPAPTRLLEEGDHVKAGRLSLLVIHTPGHTPGGICLFAAPPKDGSDTPHLFAGDTLFARSVGRFDLPGGDARALRASLGRLAMLPLETVVHTGHGPDTTIGREVMLNPFLPRV